MELQAVVGGDFQASMNMLKKEGIETHSEVLDFKSKLEPVQTGKKGSGEMLGVSEVFLLLWG